MYTYGNNNPIKYIDPSGHYAQVLEYVYYEAPAVWDKVQYAYYMYGPEIIYQTQQAGVWITNNGAQAWEGIKNAKENVSDASKKAWNWTKEKVSGGSGGAPDPNKFNNKDKVKSLLSNDSGLVKQAEKMGKNQKVQEEANKLINQYLDGNTNPGIGTKNLFKDVYYLRGKHGARIFYRMNDGVMEILGKSSKENEQKVIEILKNLYQ